MKKQAETPVTEPIACKTTEKLLARVDAHGIYLWCKACRCEHYIEFTSLPIKEVKKLLTTA